MPWPRAAGVRRRSDERCARPVLQRRRVSGVLHPARSVADPLPPSQPGDLIRTEPSRLVLEPSGQLGAIMATGTRIIYRSNDIRGNPMAVTGTYFEPYNDWPGAGPRPLIVYGPGTQGQGDQCAPSRQFNQGIHWSPWLDIAFNYEELFVATMVARGLRHRDDRLSGPRHSRSAHVRQPGRRRQRHARCGPRGDAVTRHVTGSAWARGVLGLLAGFRRRGVGRGTGAVLRPGPPRRRHLRGRAAGRPEGAVPVRRRQRAGGRGGDAATG